jgi:hypothetical protein
MVEYLATCGWENTYGLPVDRPKDQNGVVVDYILVVEKARHMTGSNQHDVHQKQEEQEEQAPRLDEGPRNASNYSRSQAQSELG